MKAANTIISGNLETIGHRTCEVCGSSVPIIRLKTKFRENEVSTCLTCESNKVQKQCQAEFDSLEKNRNAAIFKMHSIIPDDIKSARFPGYKPTNPSQHEAKRIALAYAKDFEKIKNGQTDYHSLLFQGTYGLGKSHLAHSIAEEISKQGFSVIFIDTPQLLQFFRDNIQSKESSDSQIMKTISKVDCLILDDLGAEYVKQDYGKESWAVDKLFQIFSLRNNKPKIITTNYGSKQLSEKYGDHGGRIVSRMMMGTKFVKLEGKDFRIKTF